MRLEKASLTPPKGLKTFLIDLGDGENGFSGTPIHKGNMSLNEYLQACLDGTDDKKIMPEFVPQTIFWVINTNDIVIGMVKIRHALVPNTLINGGHVGFFIHPHHRHTGKGKQTLALALCELKKIGVAKALITVYPENKPSISIVEANGGQLEDCVFDSRTKHKINRYWISLTD